MYASTWIMLKTAELSSLHLPTEAQAVDASTGLISDASVPVITATVSKKGGATLSTATPTVPPLEKLEI